jgi:ferric-dicitrate binding protein FerR (iron transport regulator)
MSKNEYDTNLWEQAARYLAGEMDANEEADFLIDVQTNSGKTRWFKEVCNDWKEFEPVQKIDVDENGAWDALSGRIQKHEVRQKPVTRWYQLPAVWTVAAVVLMVAGYFIYSASVGKTFDSEVLAATTNEQKRVILPDGSVVFLNTNSQLSYQKDGFGTDFRTVKLQGEAFFEVHKDALHPFIVEVGLAKVKVLGTSFNVNTTDKGSVEVNVKTGRVEVSSRSESKILLLPGDRGVLHNDLLTHSRSKNENYMAWKTRCITFDGDNLFTALDVINHVYGSQITTRGLTPGRYVFSPITFNRLPLPTVLDIICTTFHLKMETKNGQVILYE